MSDAGDIIKSGLKAVSGEFASKIQSKKFLAFVIGNLMLLVVIFTVKPDGDTVIGFLKLLLIGYFGTQGGVDAIKAGAALFEKKRNGGGD